MHTKKLLGAAAFTATLAAGGVAGALLGAPGTSGALETPSPLDGAPADEIHIRHHRGPHLEAAAEVLGISEDDLRDALEDGQTIAEVAEAEGVDLDAVIDAIVGAITEDVREHVTDMVNGELPALPRRAAFAAELDVVAEVLGMTDDELHEALADDQTLAEVAEAQGVEVQALIDALVADGMDAEHAEALVNGEIRRGFGGRPGLRHDRGGPGFGFGAD